MFKVEKTGKNTFKYLTDCEKKHIGYTKYLDEDTRHFKAVLTGGLAEDMGIEYSKETLRSLMCGELPEGAINNNYDLKKGKNLIKVGKNHQVGTDLLSAPPKSVSMEFALADYEGKKKIVEAMRETDLEIQKFLAEKVKPSCKRGEYQDFDPSKTKIMVATFTHYEDRQIDPHIHNHGILMNFAEFTFNEVNEQGEMVEVKKVLALNTKEIFKNQLEMSAIYDTILNGKLREKGFKTEPATTSKGHQTFRLCGYTKEQEKRVSKRGDEINAYIEEQKKNGKHFANLTLAEAEYNELAQRNTRDKKEDLETEEIWGAIEAETKKAMLNEGVEIKDSIQITAINKLEEFDMVGFLEKNISNTDAYISEDNLRKELAMALRFTGNYTNYKDFSNEINKKIKSMQDYSLLGKNALVKSADGSYTKLITYENEKKAIDNLTNLSKFRRNEDNARFEEKKNLVLLEKFIENFKKETKHEINDGQEDACRLVAKNNDLTVIVGDAGTGKTTSVIKFAAEMHKANGAKVFGLSTQTLTAQALDEAGIPKENCLNTKQFLMQCYDKSGRYNNDFIKNNKNSVIIIDEAGMVGAEDYRKITDIATVTNSKIIIVGDQKQLSAVSYGDTFAAIQDKIDTSLISRLEINTRQVEGSSKEIAEAYRDKNIEKVFDLLKKENWLFVEKSKDKAIERLVNNYFESDIKSKIIICGTNEEIDKVNFECRTRVIQSEIDKYSLDKNYKPEYDFKNQHTITVSRKIDKVTRRTDLQFCSGDSIVFLENKKDSFKNGQIGKIKSIKKRKESFDIVVNVDGNEIKFNTNDYTSFNHSFALSSHKSQGKTFDKTFLLGSPMTTSNQSYVNGSRHRKEIELYISEDSVESYKRNAVKNQIKRTTIDDKSVEEAYEEYMRASKSSIVSPDYMYGELSRENTRKNEENSISKEEYSRIKNSSLAMTPVGVKILPRGLATMDGLSNEVQSRNLENAAKISNTNGLLNSIDVELKKRQEEEYRRSQQNAMTLQKPTPYNSGRGMSR